MAHQVLNLAMIVCSALMIWKGLMVPGDILFLHMGHAPFRAGDIVVADREIPIVHRILKVHEKVSGEVDVLTKGDNNAVDDRGLCAPVCRRPELDQQAARYLPYIGMVTIIMNDYPLVKYALVGIMGLFVLTTRE
ncbi:hypothetical protein EMIHUDRAFT_315879 [Emiliania huxleyi CCMP1516]|uniref:Signal peptidase complex catalytic subunit SEC11 n=2 Tax=Emiliania huxleyi TaxID=2903 RepID=A0A0D3JCR8_EMIH1|nr:hypothetical protein EMIHUDRAFT_315879 [Emiliania huxleyi CCMP1516]EOD21303.1 hypothetical protein EMIHUDRAFT_315879 [Emiliania huxleyi CCMP1516]|eukprot:XP_005773732.1 hypothetical protein EMIHUDRAFT_315879 [Emiliania huxleyi CCMP1516]